MRIQRLDLLAFGPFTDVTLDLSAGDEGLHLIYGGNEAGKSSALRALRQVLYGIEPKSPDDFIHEYKKMSIGAEIRKGNGAFLEFLRLKRTKNPLVRANSGSPLDAKELSAFLGGVDATTFETMFGIDHRTLVKNGEAIAAGGGDIGPMLFAAGSGITNLRSILNGLQEEAARLFKSSGSVPVINKALAELDQKRKAIREAELPSSTWVEHDQALKNAQRRLAEVETELATVERERHHLQRIGDALPLIAERNRALDDLEPYADAVLLREDFFAELQETQKQRLLADNAATYSLQRLQERDAELATLSFSQELLDHADEIDAAYKRLGSHEKAQFDRNSLLAEAKQCEAASRAILRDLRPDLDLAQVEQLRLSIAQRSQLQQLGNQHGSLVKECNDTRKRIEELIAQVADNDAKLHCLEEPRDTSALRALSQRAQQLGPLDEQIADMRRAHVGSSQRAEGLLSKLAPWTGTLDAVEHARVPYVESVERFQRDMDLIDSHQRRLEEQIKGIETETEDLERQFEQLTLEQEVPTEESLHAARNKRDEGWRLVRRAWHDNERDDEGVRLFVAELAPAQRLSEAYELSVARADEVVDRLRRESDRVATLAALLANQKQRRERLAKLREEEAQLKVGQQELEEQWKQLWQPLVIVPLSPREMVSWLRRYEEVVNQCQKIHEYAANLFRLEERRLAHYTELLDEMARLGEPSPAHPETFAALLDRCQKVVGHIDSVATNRARLQMDGSRLKGELTKVNQQKEKAQEALRTWEERWATELANLGQPAELAPGTANLVLDKTNELFQRVTEAEKLRQRIDAIDKDAKHLTKKVVALAERIATDLAMLALEQAVPELHSRSNDARTTSEKRQSVSKQRDAEYERLQVARRTLTEMNARLELLCQEAHCVKASDLTQAVESSHRRQVLEKELGQLTLQLLRLSAGAKLESFLSDATGQDPDALPSRLSQLDEMISILKTEKDTLNLTIGREEGKLAEWKGSGSAAEAAAQREELLAHISLQVEEYVRLRLASVLLEGGMERYRARHQGPILERAGEIFATLTADSFSSLSIDYDDTGKLALFGVRAGSKSLVSVAGLSDGTCDQLYLALRLASLEDYLVKNESMPFIVDDILIRFDDTRAQATLKALAELSKRTQVIFFTHHQHLVTIAERCLSRDDLYIHVLSA